MLGSEKLLSRGWTGRSGIKHMGPCCTAHGLHLGAPLRSLRALWLAVLFPRNSRMNFFSFEVHRLGRLGTPPRVFSWDAGASRHYPRLRTRRRARRGVRRVAVGAQGLPGGAGGAQWQRQDHSPAAGRPAGHTGRGRGPPGRPACLRPARGGPLRPAPAPPGLRVPGRQPGACPVGPGERHAAPAAAGSAGGRGPPGPGPPRPGWASPTACTTVRVS